MLECNNYKKLIRFDNRLNSEAVQHYINVTAEYVPEYIQQHFDLHYYVATGLYNKVRGRSSGRVYNYCVKVEI